MVLSILSSCGSTENEPSIYVDICINASGLSFEDVERKLTIPIEKILEKIKIIQSISSESTADKSHVSVSFPAEVGNSEALDLVKEKLSSINAVLPEKTPKPEILLRNGDASDTKYCK